MKSIKVIKGHLTACDIKVIKEMFKLGYTVANTKQKKFEICESENENEFHVKRYMKERGIGLGSPLRMHCSNYIIKCEF